MTHSIRIKFLPGKFITSCNGLSLNFFLVHKEIFLLFRDDEKNDEDKVLMKAIKKCTKRLGKCGVEQTATLMAWSAKNNLDVDKYRKKVLDDEKDDSD